jgi:hypothetical protein
MYGEDSGASLPGRGGNFTLHAASSSWTKLTTFVFRFRKNERPLRGEGKVSSDKEEGQGGDDGKAA